MLSRCHQLSSSHRSFQEPQSLIGHSNHVYVLAVLKDGRLASASQDKTIRLWDISQQKCVAVLTEHEATVISLAVLPNSVLVSSSYDNTIKCWDVERGACVKTLLGHDGWVWVLEKLSYGQLASGSVDASIKLWDVEAGVCLKTLLSHAGAVVSFALLSDGRLASGSRDNLIKLWDVDLDNELSNDTISLKNASASQLDKPDEIFKESKLESAPPSQVTMAKKRKRTTHRSTSPIEQHSTVTIVENPNVYFSSVVTQEDVSNRKRAIQSSPRKDLP